MVKDQQVHYLSLFYKFCEKRGNQGTAIKWWRAWLAPAVSTQSPPWLYVQAAPPDSAAPAWRREDIKDSPLLRDCQIPPCQPHVSLDTHHALSQPHGLCSLKGAELSILHCAPSPTTRDSVPLSPPLTILLTLLRLSVTPSMKNFLTLPSHLLTARWSPALGSHV